MSNSHAEGRNGDMEANDDHERFTRLLIEHEPELLRCVLVAVPNRDDARDMMQECSVALWRRFSEFDADRPFAPWALGFVRIEVRRFLRKSTRQAQLWLSDGSGIVASCVDGRIRVIDPVKVKVTQDLPAIEGWAYAIAMHPKDQSIAVGGTNGQIRRIELPEVDLASASR